MTRKNGLIATCALAWVTVFAAIPSPAAADLSACGDIDVKVQAQCEVIPPGATCESMCTPVAIRATCSAKLAAQCQANCSKLPSVSCTGQCVAGCMGDCDVDPGKFDCNVSCKADCDGRCMAGCNSSQDKNTCTASCEGACSVSCKKKCDVQLPMADCQAACQASCDGSCQVDSNLQCQVDCQSQGYASCETQVTGGCKVSCQRTEGALFCDGNYVDDGDRLQQCIDALKATLNAHVQAQSSGQAGCDAGKCQAHGQASVKTNCSVVHIGAREPFGFAAFGLAGALSSLRYRRRRPR